MRLMSIGACVCCVNIATSRAAGSGSCRPELIEEAGASAAEWSSLGTYLSSPGVFTEVIHLFLATAVTSATAAHESAEVIEVHWVALAQAQRWALDGTIRDGKTVVGIVRAAAKFNP